MPDAGTLTVERLVPTEATKQGLTGVAFQDAALLPWRNVEANIALPLDVLGGSCRTIAAHCRTDQARRARGLREIPSRRASRPCASASPLPERWRRSPTCCFRDEPFGALLRSWCRATTVELQRIWMETRATTLLVTHGIDEAVSSLTALWATASRPGRIGEDHRDRPAAPAPPGALQ